MRVGYFLSCEEYGPLELLEQARMAEGAGFEALWISDHYHPWNDEQGQSPFVWSVIGGLSQVTSRIPVYTAVTCPTIRIHPAVIAQAAATSAAMLPGRFGLGVGSGEALNEHIFGDAWPSTDVRLEMLEEAIEVMRLLWEGGVSDYEGRHYAVENARIYTLPDEPPPILVSGFGPKATQLAGRIGDGYMNVAPDADLLNLFRSSGGGDKPAHGAFKVCYGEDEAERRKTAYRLWANEGLPGELAQVLPTPRHFEQATQLVTEEMIAEAIPCGPDPEPHRETIRQYDEAGYDEVYVSQIGGNMEAFFELYREEILPEFR
ncbi:TIGR03557 family F420-dependent LLM class oxidoreductase [Rubrobacter marinus]|uniref:TIGR03557 family F420-dependent LLM class oxidoreductase n=1 Tax=Rubrobacter marinus TaxID=2653852 RepID=A0A6G8PYZ4_9ACTN|nr:LLM class F420-dependent oxidoreductase [Rubrobacter marinus]QIN79449.1 TIGR03557 family F420-dependent LLM class oxidoreductase [Rubrobacter marinus]